MGLAYSIDTVSITYLIHDELSTLANGFLRATIPFYIRITFKAKVIDDEHHRVRQTGA